MKRSFLALVTVPSLGGAVIVNYASRAAAEQHDAFTPPDPC
jgi:hypothetical protein